MDFTLLKDKISQIVDESAEEVLELTKELVRIPSRNPPGEYERISKFIADKLKDIGFDVTVVRSKPTKPNVIARLKGVTGKPTLMYSSHMDTVPEGSGWTVDPFGATTKEGKIFGRGSLDAKSRIAVYIMAAKTLLDAGLTLKGDLLEVVSR